MITDKSCWGFEQIDSISFRKPKFVVTCGQAVMLKYTRKSDITFSEGQYLHSIDTAVSSGGNVRRAISIPCSISYLPDIESKIPAKTFQ